MVLESFCGPSLLYLGFSLIQIIIDLYKGLYNTTFIKFIITILFTIFLNILCDSGLTVISWFVVFIPFISMTVITTLLLFVFGLDPSSGNLNYNIVDYNNNFKYNSSGTWRLIYADGTVDYVTLNNGYYELNGQSFQLLNTAPITINWPDGTIQTLDVVNNNGGIRWTTNHTLNKYSYMVWVPINNADMTNLDPCPPNMTPTEYNMYYGDHCGTKNMLDNFTYNSSGNYKVIYYDGTYHTINLNNGMYNVNNNAYTLINTSPITIEWPDGTIQTVDTIDTNDNFIRWTTTNDDNKYTYIIWEPINDNPLLNIQNSNLYNNPYNNNQYNQLNLNSAYTSCVTSCSNTCNSTLDATVKNIDPSYCENNCNKFCMQQFQSSQLNNPPINNPYVPSTSSLLPPLDIGQPTIQPDQNSYIPQSSSLNNPQNRAMSAANT